MTWGIKFAFCVLLFSAPALAHDGHDHGHSPAPVRDQLQLSPSFVKLTEHLDVLYKRNLAHPRALPTLEEERLGQILLEAVHVEWEKQLSTQTDPVLRQKIMSVLSHVLNHMNPAQLGRAAWKTMLIRGAYTAALLVGSEVFEKATYLVAGAVDYRALPVLIPVNEVFHLPNLIAVVGGNALPFAWKTLRLWQKHGGVLKGPYGYMAFLKKQREVLPLDWNEIIHMGVFPLPGVESNSDPMRFVVYEQSWVTRSLPRMLKMVFCPEKLSFCESAPAIGIWEIERIAKRHGVSLQNMKIFKDLNQEVYVMMLVHEIAETTASYKEFEALVAMRNKGKKFLQTTDEASDISNILNAANALQLKATGQTPDILARRLLWHFEDIKIALTEKYESNAFPKKVREPMSKLRGLLSRSGAIVQLANTEPQKVIPLDDFERLLEAMVELKELTDELVREFDQIDALKTCQAQLKK